MILESPGQAELHSEVKARVGGIESFLFENEGIWLNPTARRIEWLLNDLDLRREFRDWLKLETHSKTTIELSTPVKEWLQTNGYELTAEDQAAVYLHNRLPDAGLLPKGVAELATILGLQYTVLQYFPGLQEFRGAFLQSNLLSNRKLEEACKSLRVQKKRGAVNWMTSLLLGGPSTSRPRPFIVTLHDASLDLRGRVAAQDLVLGNRSVSGFAVLDYLEESLAGYFFVSHPVPGLFVDELRPSSFETILHDVYAQTSTRLAEALEIDLFGSVGEAALVRSEQWDRKNLPDLTAPPIVSLSTESPTGFLAALVATPVQDQVGSPVAEWSLSCQINEQPYSNSIWSQQQLTCTFFEHWADRVARHMKSFAEVLSQTQNSSQNLPRMAWIPQYRLSDNYPHDPQRLSRYYPDGALLDYSQGLPGNREREWIEWHLKTLEQSERATKGVETPIHTRLNSALAVYSSEEASDLVVSLMGRERREEKQRVVGFLRFNCYPAPRERERISFSRADLDKFRRLYEIISKHLESLDRTVGVLFAWADLQMRRFLENPEEATIPTYKQAIDSARVLADWIVLFLSSILSRTDPPHFDIVRHVFTYLSQQTAISQVEHERDWLAADLAAILAETPSILTKIGHDLSDEPNSLPEISVITLWLHTSKPVAMLARGEVLSIGDRFQDLAELLERDPGLPQLLTYLSYTKAERRGAAGGGKPLNLLSRLRLGYLRGENSTSIEIFEESESLHRFSHVLDLGVPPRGSGIVKLELTPAESAEGRERMALCWRLKGDSEDKHVQLKWSWGQESDRAKLHPYPMAVHPVQGRVSQRVGSVVGANARIRITSELKALEPRRLVALNEAVEFIAPPHLEKTLLQLEQAIVGDLAQRQGWWVLPVARQGFILMLVSADPPSSIVRAFRNIALAYERGAYLAAILGQEIYQSRTLAEQLAAIGHGYTGPVGNLRHEMTLVKTQWDSQEEIDRADVLARMREFLQQASSIIRLGEAAIAYARISVALPEASILNGREIVAEVREVISAYQPREKGVIEAILDDEWQLSAFQAKLATPLFIHGLSKLIDNAVKAARKPLVGEPKVRLVVRLSGASLLIKIENTGDSLGDAKLFQIQRGLISGDLEPFRPGAELRPRLGLGEAWACFQALNIQVDVRRAEGPFVLAVTLTLRPHR